MSPGSVLNVINNCEPGSMDKVQNPDLASIFETFLTLLMLLVMSWNVLALCTLNLKALFMVCVGPGTPLVFYLVCKLVPNYDTNLWPH